MVAYVRGTLTDRAIMIVCTVAMSISFLVYIIVGQWLFGFILGWFPVQGWSESFWKNLVNYAPLPIMLALFVGLAPELRLYRSFFLDEINQDYVRTARAKGLSEKTVMFKHVLRNALIPILTNVGIYLPGVFVGSFLLEVFFSIPGLGREVVTAVNRSDFPGDQGGDGLPRGVHHDRQPAGRRDVQVRRPARRVQMRRHESRPDPSEAAMSAVIERTAAQTQGIRRPLDARLAAAARTTASAWSAPRRRRGLPAR